MLKSIAINGRDLADVPIDLKPGERVTDVVVTFTDRVTEISGTLLDAAGRPAPGYYVVLFSTDEIGVDAGVASRAGAGARGHRRPLSVLRACPPARTISPR